MRLEVRQDLGGLLVAKLSVNLQAFHHHVVEVFRDGRIELRGRRGPFLRALDQQGDCARGLMRRLAGQQLVENNSQSEKIGARIGILPLGLLRRHVFRSADQDAGLGQSRHFQRARDAEVHHRDFAKLIHHDVLGLQVPVHHAFRVRGLQGFGDLPDDRRRRLRRILPALGQRGPEVLSLDVLHGDELDPLGFPQVINADHIFVSNLTRQNQFLLEPREDFRVARELRTNNFQHH